MPAMHHLTPDASTWQSLMVVAAMLGFWTAAVLHLLRLVAHPILATPDVAGDLAHAAMALAMSYMLFPDAWTGLDRPAAVGFTCAATGFGIRAAHPSAPSRRRAHDVTLTVTGLVMALMLAVGRPSSPVVLGAAIIGLVACAAYHLRALTHVHARREALSPRQERLLVRAPGYSIVATTLGMAVMIAVM